MKKSAEIKRNTFSLIAKNLIILVVLAVVAFVGAFSWFTQHTKATADGINAMTKANDKLEFYIMPPSDSDQYAAINQRLRDNATWNSQHSSETPKRTEWHRGNLAFDFSDQEFKFMDGLFMSEVTGDGASFKIPKLMQYNNVAYIDSTQAFENAVANDNYMSFDLYFRSQSNYSIALTNESTIEPVDTADALSGQHDYTGDAQEASMKPGAIGAVRMSILNCEANNERELLWIPAPNVWYNGLTDHLYTGLTASGSGNYSFSDKGSAYYDESDTTKLKLTTEGTTTHAFYSANNANRTTWANGTYNVIASTAGDYRLGSDSSDDVTVVTLQNQDNDYRYGHIRVNLWIEGEDAEARLRLVNGKFNMSLYFDIKDTVQATESGS
ncbi:hypothetical protein [Ruminococcus sp.]|uniref:hypothetical protein n=1 Tax=Ruminococcus sp. TaxID=41978 RepID=UPI00389096F0